MGSSRVSILTGALLTAVPLWCADSALLFRKSIGGSGIENVTAIATDPAGYVIAAGVTGSYDFPVTDGSRNTATHFAASTDAAASWRPLSSLPSGRPLSLVVDTSKPPVWYTTGTTGVFKSIDSGASWQDTGPRGLTGCASVGPDCTVFTLAINPAQPSTIYATSSAGFLKTTDAGANWYLLPPPAKDPNPPSYLALDPFHPDRVFTHVAGSHFRSFDGGQTWTQFTPQLLHPNSFCSPGVAFDHVTPDSVYLSDHCDLFRSTDGGIYWNPVTAPFQNAFNAVTHPTRAGSVYVFSVGGLYVSSDAGVSWTLLLSTPNGAPPGLLAFDPAQPLIIVTDTAISNNGGATWTPLLLGRNPIAIVFDPAQSGRAIAASGGASTGFIARLDSAGTILAATYLGGQGGTQIAGVSADAAGNIYVTGYTNALDFPTASNALQTAPPGTIRNFFATKYDSNLKLTWSTYLPGFTTVNAIAVDPQGSAVIAGTSVPAFWRPLQCFVTKLTPDGRGTVFTTTFGGSNGDVCYGVAADATGNTVVAGQTFSPDFPLAGNATQTKRQGDADAIVARLDPTGALVYSSYLGGGDRDGASSVAVDAAGNIYVTGNTASKDFPVTGGAYQTKLGSNCAYPSSAIATGIIGTIFSYQTDDAFVTKLDPNGNFIYSTHIGAGCYDTAAGIAVDSSGNAWISGSSDSNPFPQVTPFESGPIYSSYKTFVAELDSGGGSLRLSSYITGGSVIAADGFGNAYLGGSSGGHTSLAKVQPQFPAPLAINSAGNGFTLRDGPVSPGQITLIAANGLTPANPQDLTLMPSAPLPRTLADTQVLFDGEPAALISVSAGRVVAVAPYDLAGKKQTSVQVVFQGVVSPPVAADILPDAGYLSADGSGTGQAYARNPDGTLNSMDNPAPRGSVVIVYVTGAGLSDPACPEGGVATDVTPYPNSKGLGLKSVPGYACGMFQLAIQTPNFGPVPKMPLLNTPLTYAVQ